MQSFSALCLSPDTLPSVWCQDTYIGSCTQCPYLTIHIAKMMLASGGRAEVRAAQVSLAPMACPHFNVHQHQTTQEQQVHEEEDNAPDAAVVPFFNSLRITHNAQSYPLDSEEVELNQPQVAITNGQVAGSETAGGGAGSAVGAGGAADEDSGETAPAAMMMERFRDLTSAEWGQLAYPRPRLTLELWDLIEEKSVHKTYHGDDEARGGFTVAGLFEVVRDVARHHCDAWLHARPVFDGFHRLREGVFKIHWRAE